MNSFHNCVLVVECHWKYLAPRIRVLLKSHIAEKEATRINGSWSIKERAVFFNKATSQGATTCKKGVSIQAKCKQMELL